MPRWLYVLNPPFDILQDSVIARFPLPQFHFCYWLRACIPLGSRLERPPGQVGDEQHTPSKKGRYEEGEEQAIREYFSLFSTHRLISYRAHLPRKATYSYREL